MPCSGHWSDGTRISALLQQSRWSLWRWDVDGDGVLQIDVNHILCVAKGLSRRRGNSLDQKSSTIKWIIFKQFQQVGTPQIPWFIEVTMVDHHTKTCSGREHLKCYCTCVYLDYIPAHYGFRIQLWLNTTSFLSCLYHIIYNYIYIYIYLFI